jgi:hypothetical protein
MTTVAILEGSMPPVKVGEAYGAAEGLFITDYTGSVTPVVEHTVSSTAWIGGEVLRGEVLISWLPRRAGERWIFRVSITPQRSGGQIFRLRVVLNGVEGPEYFATLATAYPTIDGYITYLEDVTAGGAVAAAATTYSNWVGPDGRVVTGLTTSNSGVRAGGTGNPRFVRPTGAGANAVVKFTPEGAIQWVVWVSNTANSARTLTVDEQTGDIYFSQQWNNYGSTNSVRLTVHNADGTLGFDQTSTNSVGMRHAIIKLDTQGFVTASTWIERPGVTALQGTGSLDANGGRVAFSLPQPITLTEIIVAGQSYPVPAGTTGTRHGICVFDRDLAPVYVTAWVVGASTDHSNGRAIIALTGSGRLYACADAPRSSSSARISIMGSTLALDERFGVAAFTPNGSLLWLRGLRNSRQTDTAHYATVAGDDDEVVVWLLTQRWTANSYMLTFGSDSASYTGATTQRAFNLLGLVGGTGAPRYMREVTVINSSNNHWTGDISPPRFGETIFAWHDNTSGAMRIYRAEVDTGTVLNAVNVAGWTPAGATRPRFGLAPSGTGAGHQTATTLTSANGSVAATHTAARNWIATLDRAGTWGRQATDDDGTGDPTPDIGTEPSAPKAVWPAELPHGETLEVHVTGKDPLNTGTAAYLVLFDPVSGNLVDPSEPLAYEGGSVQIFGNGGPIAGGRQVVFTGSQAFTAQRTEVAFVLRWAIFDPVADAWRIGPLKDFRTDFVKQDGGGGEPGSPVTGVSGQVEDFDEDTVGYGDFTFDEDPHSTGTYTWQVSGDIDDPGSEAGTSVTLRTDEAHACATAEIVQHGTTGRVRITPRENYNGPTRLAVRVSNGRAWSSWRSDYFYIDPVEDPPGAVTTELPTVGENGQSDFYLHFTDVDVDPLAIGTLPTNGSEGYRLELGLVRRSSAGSFEVTAWTDNSFLETDQVVVRVLSYHEELMRVTARVEAKAGATGTYRLAFRIRRNRGANLVGQARIFTGTIQDVEHPPSVFGQRMPHARYGESVEGAFQIADPDKSASATIAIAASKTGAYSTALTLTGGVSLEVLTGAPSLTGRVRMEQAEPGASVRSYSFWLRATDNSGLTSTPIRVTGTIGAPSAGLWLQRLVRTETAATLVKLAPLTRVSSLRLTQALDGAGQAEVEVDAAELNRRATEAGEDLDAWLEAGAVELRIAVGEASEFVGPVTDVEWQAGDALVRFTARGLLSYLDDRRLSEEREFVNVDLSQIAAVLLTAAQAQPYGSLAIGTGIVPVGTNATLTFERDTTIAAALGELSAVVGAPEIWIDGDRVLRAAPARGSDNRDRVRITSSMASVASWTGRSESLVTRAVVEGATNTGSGEKVFRGSYTDPQAAARYGLVERHYQAPLLLTDAACEALAERIVKASASAARAVSLELTVTAESPFELTDLGCGDVVKLDLRDERLGKVTGSFRIMNRTVTLVEEATGTYSVDLDLEPVAFVAGRIVGSRSRHNPAVFTKLSTVAAMVRR